MRSNLPPKMISSLWILESAADALEPTPEGALDALLYATIWHFGYVARDVFQAVRNFDTITMEHEAALAISHSALKDAIATLARGEHCHNVSMSNCIVLSKNLFSPDTFKST
jgi:hypothetical protein